MKYFYHAMACFLHVCLGGCLDYVNLEEKLMSSRSENFPPVIDTKHLSPHPSRLVDSISVGKNCRGQTFKVPPIEDRNLDDRLYFLWLLDEELVWPQSSIEPDFRESAIITLDIEEQTLLSHFETKIPSDFYEKPHIIEFYVSDLPYRIPESRYIDDRKNNERDHVDYAYWIVYFSSDPC